MKKEANTFTYLLVAGIVLLLIITSINIYSLSSLSDKLVGKRSSGLGLSKDVDDVNLASIRSTGQSIAFLFPVEKIKTQQDAIDILIPRGTPEYGDALGVSYDDPVSALNKLARQTYPQIKAELKQDPVLWNRYLNLATKPVGISCEFCCGVGPTGISGDGELTCGCSHNPAIHALTMWLMKNTDYSDAEILREAIRWKSLWFPKDIVNLGLKASGGDIEELDLPGMVGGC